MKYRIQALSPIHIGDKEQSLSTMDFVTLDGRCWVLSEKKLFSVLVSKGKIEEFQRFIEKLTAESGKQRPNRGGRKFQQVKDDKPRLTGFLSQAGMFNSKTMGQIARYSTLCPFSPSDNFRPMVRDAFERPYIPGSSIKGVLRNAVSYRILKALSEDDRSKYFRRADQKLSTLKSERKLTKQAVQFFSHKILDDLLSNYELSEAKKGPNTDLFRLVLVTDTFPLDKDSAVVEEVKVYSVDSYESPKKWSFYVETIPAGSELTFTIDIDRRTFWYFKDQNSKSATGLGMEEILGYVADPVACVKELARDIIEYDRDFVTKRLGLSDVYDFESSPDIRLGWGGGFLSTSVNLLRRDRERRKFLDTINAETARPGAPGPKSRRFVCRGNEPVASLGWAKIEGIP